MSTLLHDIPTQAAFALALSPRTLADDATGSSVELTDGDGPAFALVQLGNLEEDTTVTVAFEQSSGDGSWAEVTTTLPTLTAANAVSVVALSRTARYLRCQVTLGGGTPQADIAVLIGQQKKVV